MLMMDSDTMHLTSFPLLDTTYYFNKASLSQHFREKRARVAIRTRYVPSPGQHVCVISRLLARNIRGNSLASQNCSASDDVSQVKDS